MHVMCIVHYNTAQCTDNDEDDGDSARITHYYIIILQRPPAEYFCTLCALLLLYTILHANRKKAIVGAPILIAVRC